MNERSALICLRDLMDRSDGWGRAQGREVHQRLLSSVNTRPGVDVFRISFAGVERLDTSFASETIVEIARRFRGEKGFCIVELSDEDMIENIDLAASKKTQPIFLWTDGKAKLLGPQPSQGTRDALEFALCRDQVRSAEFTSSVKGMSASNASMKFKALWHDGYLLRRESASDTGGLEHIYSRIA